ncbi:unnamed protein product [Dovyalis caffra]|uniref:Uncharacterized protein n=1 Tax=Dovyalis caffra TaxID=77055 RepID=A0AAV1RQE8_9ROSI|nr:unnamed protein product [Dovyalis caffra]
MTYDGQFDEVRHNGDGIEVSGDEVLMVGLILVKRNSMKGVDQLWERWFLMGFKWVYENGRDGTSWVMIGGGCRW